MIKKLIFTRGLPGSGKSTIAEHFLNKHHDSCSVCATDNYWLRPDGIYDFNWELLGKAHAWNQGLVRMIMKEEADGPYDSIIIVDNTNINFSEMKPYIKMALEYEYDVEFMEPATEWRYDVEECFKRNTHGVPYATILKMSQKWEDRATVMAKLEQLKNV